jgi:hypothetical protein
MATLSPLVSYSRKSVENIVPISDPLPPLRPKRAAYGVAGLRSESGQRDSRRALMAKPLASMPRPMMGQNMNAISAQRRYSPCPDLAARAGQ